METTLKSCKTGEFEQLECIEMTSLTPDSIRIQICLVNFPDLTGSIIIMIGHDNFGEKFNHRKARHNEYELSKTCRADRGPDSGLPARACRPDFFQANGVWRRNRPLEAESVFPPMRRESPRRSLVTLALGPFKSHDSSLRPHNESRDEDVNEPLNDSKLTLAAAPNEKKKRLLSSADTRPLGHRDRGSGPGQVLRGWLWLRRKLQSEGEGHLGLDPVSQGRSRGRVRAQPQVQV